MNSTCNDPRYSELLQAIRTMHDGISDPLGRPRYQHFERVVERLKARNPDAPIAQVEAALLHDVLTHEAGGHGFLERLAVTGETLDILERIVPPPNANYYQDINKFTAADNADYLAYVEALINSAHAGAIAVKLADVEDTVALLREIGGEVALTQLARQYEPSRQLLEAGMIH